MNPFYNNMFVILMSVFMCMSGVLLTALAYRPKEIAEEWWEWTERFYKSETPRIAGPILIVLSLILHISSVTYCIIKRIRRRDKVKEREDSDSLEVRSMDLDTKCLLDKDIACFPDGSLRSSSSQIRNTSENSSVSVTIENVQHDLENQNS